MWDTFPIFWETRNVQVYFMFIWGNTKCQVLYVCIQEPTTVEYFSCIFWQNTKCAILFAYSRNHKCGVFSGNAKYLYTFKKTQNVEYFTLVFNECWVFYVNVKCLMHIWGTKIPSTWMHIWENKKCPIVYPYSRNHICQVFVENVKYFYAYLRIHECRVFNAYLRNHKCQVLSTNV